MNGLQQAQHDQCITSAVTAEDGWTLRDLDILLALTCHVRLLEVTQIRLIWWPTGGSLRVVRRRLRRLSLAGLIQAVIVNAHPLLQVHQPLARWRPGAEAPDFAHVARQAQARWQLASVPCEVYCATPLAANLFGSSAGRLPPVHQRDHDLLLAQVYVLYRTRAGQLKGVWVGEDTRPKAGYRIKDPDAWLVDSQGRPICVIESTGRYSTQQVESFHEHCVEFDLSYQLW